MNLATLASALVLLGWIASPSGADDFGACVNESGDVAIAACSNAIVSGKYSGHDLARIYLRRSVLHQLNEDYDRAIADAVEGILIDHKASR